MSGSQEMVLARQNKNDEWYTQLSDIEKEMVHYRNYFKGKTVLCNCDDPFESNFFKYFALNFNFLGLKKLIATSYISSPVVYGQLSFEDLNTIDVKENHPYKIEINEVNDENADGRIDITDVEYLIKNKKNVLSLLSGDGDFRSEECIELLKKADIVCTNPPFSLFEEYLKQLLEYKKEFIILGNVTALTLKNIFPFYKDGVFWMGYSIHSGDREFRVPDDYPLEAASSRIDENGVKYIRVKGVRWFTNLDYKERHEQLILYKSYEENKECYPKYDFYDVIFVSNTSDIPCDYYGAMGVPITFLDKFCPEQFELLDARDYTDIERLKNKNTLLIKDADGKVNGKPKFARIVIRRKV